MYAGFCATARGLPYKDRDRWRYARRSLGRDQRNRLELTDLQNQLEHPARTDHAQAPPIVLCGPLWAAGSTKAKGRQLEHGHTATAQPRTHRPRTRTRHGTRTHGPRTHCTSAQTLDWSAPLGGLCGPLWAAESKGLTARTKPATPQPPNTQRQTRAATADTHRDCSTRLID